MKCRRHPFADGVGVCAFCLRERLSTIVITVSSSTSAAESLPDQPNLDCAAADEPRRCDGSNVDEPCRRRGKLSFLSAYLGHSQSDERGGDPTAAKPTGETRSWFLALIDRRRKKKKEKQKQRLTRLISADAAAVVADRRGMSPDCIEPEIGGYDTDSPCGFRKSEVSPKRWMTPQPQHLGGGLAGFAICLSPFMKTNPARRRKHLLEVTHSGQISQQLAPHQRGRGRRWTSE